MTALITSLIIVGHPVGPAPTASAIPMTCHMPGLDEADRLLLARLLVAETRGLPEPERSMAGAAVLDAVCERMRTGVMSDGTVYTTLEWHSPGGPYQFPPWTWAGCEWVHPSACLDGVPLNPFLKTVERWEAGYLQSPLSRPLPYYHSMPGWVAQECIEAYDGGMWICWHDGSW